MIQKIKTIIQKLPIINQIYEVYFLPKKIIKYNLKHKLNNYNNILKHNNKKIELNSNFLNNDINLCFKERHVKGTNKDNLKRIIKSYKKAKFDQKKQTEAYQIGNEWLPIYLNCMDEIIKGLLNEDVEFLQNEYENFMRKKCSVGLHGMADDMFKNYFQKNITPLNRNLYLYDSIYRYEYWKELTENKYEIADLFMPLFGNTYGYYIGNTFIRTGAEYLHYYGEKIKKMLENYNNPIIVEVGGGYGGLAYFLNKNINNLKYIDYDLPENMALTAYYLLSSFPDKKILLYGEENNTDILNIDFDIAIMPNFALPNLPNNSIDLVFNSYSLAEMSKISIETYIEILSNSSKNYFMHINHNYHSFTLNADNFGIEKYNFNLIEKKKALWNSGRNIEMDEFEYLYKKMDLT